MYRGGSVAKVVDANFRVISTNSLTRTACSSQHALNAQRHTRPQELSPSAGEMSVALCRECHRKMSTLPDEVGTPTWLQDISTC